MLKTIRNATKTEMDSILIAWARNEGWNPGTCDGESFYTCDNNGFWVGITDNDEIVCCMSLVRYPESDFSFVGFYIVMPEYRGQHYGYDLWQNIIGRFPERNMALDGISAQVGNYEKNGFIFSNYNYRYCGKPSRKPYDNRFLKNTTEVSFELIVDYDRLHFPAKRHDFLKSWIKNSGKSIVYYKNDMIEGFGVIRKCFDGYKIGPLFCDSYDIAYNILMSLTSDIDEDENIYLDIVENNIKATELMKDLNWTNVFNTSRMYTKSCPNIKWSGVFGLTTFEIG